MKTYIKDKEDFLKNQLVFAGIVFWRIVDDKIHVRCIAPCFIKEVRIELLKIKN